MREYIITEHPDFPYEEPKPQELIRCKDCRFYNEKYGWCDCYLLMHLETGENDYCSKAERKEE